MVTSQPSSSASSRITDPLHVHLTALRNPFQPDMSPERPGSTADRLDSFLVSSCLSVGLAAGCWQLRDMEPMLMAQDTHAVVECLDVTAHLPFCFVESEQHFLSLAVAGSLLIVKHQGVDIGGRNPGDQVIKWVGVGVEVDDSLGQGIDITDCSVQNHMHQSATSRLVDRFSCAS